MARYLTSFFLAACLTIASSAVFASMNPFGPTGLPLTQGDIAQMAAAVDPLLNDESLPVGTSRDWSNEESGNSGKITLLKRFQYNYNGSTLNCRKLQYRFEIKGEADPYRMNMNRCAVGGKWKFL
jgi:surface antigen